MHSLRCDCKRQFDAAMKRIAHEKVGILLYMRDEGRGIGSSIGTGWGQDHDALGARDHGGDRRHERHRRADQDRSVALSRPPEPWSFSPAESERENALFVKLKELLP